MPNPSERDRKIKVFLDSSVIIAALLSFSGGSFRLMQPLNLKQIILLL